ncbi:MAG: aldehyde ferredoxin oxidoreductase family protein [Thermoplasmata archaeon]
MLNRVLFIDLARETFQVKELDDLFSLHLGGIGGAVELLHKHCPKGVDPYHESAPIILSIGPLEVMFPCCNKTVSVFKSPLTGNLGESYVGGKLGLSMRFADYGAIVIKGKANQWTYLSIHDDEVAFKNATTLKGLSTYATARVLREVEKGRGSRSVASIGPAGENLVRFANVNVDDYRHFGRLGLGAVFGSKRLKAITISGSKSFDVEDKSRYETIYRAIHEILVKTPMMAKYHDLGTPVNILPLNELKCLPTKNLQESRFDSAEDISGERFAREYLTRKIACAQCPVGCIHVATLRIPFGEHEYESMKVSYDFELLYALGSMLGIGSPENILRLIEMVESKGLDAMSTGVVLAWMTEAYERGLISSKETLGVPLYWGNAENHAKAIDRIVKKSNEFYDAAGDGVVEASSTYGGEDFALALGRNEVAGYHCGYATILGQLFGGRHSHLDNAGYSLDQKMTSSPLKSERLVDQLITEEQERCVFNSLVACLFARGMYSKKMIADALEVAGAEREVRELDELGELIYESRMRFKFREGFDVDDLRIPKRFFETEAMGKSLKEERLGEMTDIYAERLQGLR